MPPIRTRCSGLHCKSFKGSRLRMFGFKRNSQPLKFMVSHHRVWSIPDVVRPRYFAGRTRRAYPLNGEESGDLPRRWQDLLGQAGSRTIGITSRQKDLPLTRGRGFPVPHPLYLCKSEPCLRLDSDAVREQGSLLRSIANETAPAIRQTGCSGRINRRKLWRSKDHRRQE